jgi:capsular polysaccharide biosynthesis protein
VATEIARARFHTVGLGDLVTRDRSIARLIYNDPGVQRYFPSTLRVFYGGGAMPLALWRNIVAPQTYKSAPIYLAALRDCFITPSGVIVTSDGRIIEEGMHPFSLDTADPGFLSGLPQTEDGRIDVRSEAFATAKRVDRAIFGRELGESGFFHLMTSLVPRVLTALDILRHESSLATKGARAAELPILFEPWTDIAAQAMHLFGFAPLVLRSDGGVFRVGELYFPSPSQTGDSHFSRSAELLAAYQKLTLDVAPEALPRGVAEHNGRLYVSRADAPTRRLTNESDVLAAISGMKFGPVLSSKLTLSDQIALFRKSYIVVAGHGAGLANVIFMKPGSVVVEMLPSDRIWPSYRVLSALCGLEYIAVVGDAGDKGDYTVDADTVLRVVSSALGDYSNRSQH